MYPTISADLLTCAIEPIVPEKLTTEEATDADAQTYGEEVRRAGEDCRFKLLDIRNLVATWPK